MADTDVAIIGAGTAGLTAAIYARRAGRSVKVFEGEIPGGQIVNTPEIANFPALPGISGYDYADRLTKQAQEAGAELIFDKVKSVEGSFAEGFKIACEYGATADAKTIIIATGVKRRTMGIDGEYGLVGKGISYCATCDGAFFKGKTVAVFGGGNTAVEDALYLSGLSGKVYVIHRRDEFRADKVLVDELMHHDNIELKLSYVVSAVKGDDKLTGVTLTSTKDSSTKELPVDALFVAIGLIPENKQFEGMVELDEAGYIAADDDCETSCEGIFAAGDCRSKKLRQLVTAASDGAVAAMRASALSQSR